MKETYRIFIILLLTKTYIHLLNPDKLFKDKYIIPNVPSQLGDRHHLMIISIGFLLLTAWFAVSLLLRLVYSYQLKLLSCSGYYSVFYAIQPEGLFLFNLTEFHLFLCMAPCRLSYVIHHYQMNICLQNDSYQHSWSSCWKVVDYKYRSLSWTHLCLALSLAAS